jgi:hypothetical protein
VTDSPRRDRRPSLGELHDRALEEPSDAAADGAVRFVAWLQAEHAERREEPGLHAGTASAVSPSDEATPWWRGCSTNGLRGLAIAAAAIAVAWLAHRAVSGGAHVPEAARPAPPPPALPAGPAWPVAPVVPVPLEPGDPCRDVVRAGGAAPLVDDFEDNNELVALLEARNGYWVTITDTDPAVSESVLVPSVRPDAAAGNRYALHLSGPRRVKWGASVQLELGPTCYDASVYRGIAFDVLGPGRVYAGVREVDAVPVERGGTCQSGCYESHLQAVYAASHWTHHEVAWTELRQRGSAKPVDPRRLSGLEFLVRPEDTPYDLWIDDVTFVR